MEEIDLLITDQDETPADSPMITIIEENEQTKAQETKEESIVPPPGFRSFQWPHAEWEQTRDATLDPGRDFVASWSARIMEERSSTPPLLPLSPIIVDDSQDFIVVQGGAGGFSGDWKIQTDRTRPDSISAPAPATPTDERPDPVRKAGAGRRFPLPKHFVGPSNGCYTDVDGIKRK